MNGDMDSEAFLVNEKARLLYMQAPAANIVAIVFALTVYFVVHGLKDDLMSAAWVVLLILASMMRFWLWRQYRLGPDLRENTAWLFDYTLLSGVMGLAWGGAFISAPADMQPYQVVALLMLYFGIAMAAYVVLSVHLPALFVYTTPSLLSLNYVFYQQPELSYRIFIPATTVYFLAIWIFARNYNKRLVKSFLLEQRNKQLVDALRDEVSQRDDQVAHQTEQLRQTNKALVQSEEQLKNVISGANLGFWDWEYQTGYHQVNDRWLEMLGLNRNEIQNDVTDWSDRVHPEDRERMQQLVKEAIDNGTPYVGDFRMRHKDGHWVWIQGSGSVVEYDQHGVAQRLCGIHEEITDRKSLERQLEYQATHDALTGLLNRRQLWERLEIELSRAQRHNEHLVLFLLDIDHFKQINDTLGHKTGDLVLQGFAALLDSQLRRMDLCGRYGGEEFVVVLPETEIDKAVGMAERLRSLVEQSDRLAAGLRLSITVSIGIAAYPQHGETSSELIDAADQALYRAKNTGRNRIDTAIT